MSASGASRLTTGRIALLAALGALGSLAIHMFVPAMPAVARELRAAPGTIQLAVTLYLVSLGVGQLVSGPATDRVGRRPVLLAGVVLFIAGSALAAAANDAAMLLAARAVQAFGGAACLVAIRAVVADLAAPDEVASRVAALTTVLLVSPAVSPVVGGAIATWGGWRTIFVVLALAAVATGLACYALIGETLRAPAAGSTAGITRSYVALLRNRTFVRFALALACCSCAFHIILTASAFLLIERYGLAPATAGLCYSLVALASIAGTLAVRRLERSDRALRVGLACPAVAGVLLAVLAAGGVDGVAALVVPMLVVGFGIGLAAPAAIAGAMRAESRLAGTAASLVGALQMGASGLTASLIVQWHVGTLGWLGAGVLAMGALGFALAPRARDR